MGVREEYRQRLGDGRKLFLRKRVHTPQVLRLRESMQIFVNVGGGRHIGLVVLSDDSIKMLKDQIRACTGTPPDQQLLTFEGNQLEDDHTLSDYNIPEESLVVMGAFGHRQAKLDKGSLLGYYRWNQNRQVLA